MVKVVELALEVVEVAEDVEFAVGKSHDVEIVGQLHVVEPLKAGRGDGIVVVVI